MKNTFKNIIAKVASISAALLFGTMAFAQDGAVKFDKKVTPEPDENGVYTISLEAYVTGSVTVTTSPAPADIVLVLDYSRSMQGNPISTLRTAVQEFVDVVKTSDSAIKAEDKDELGGHRIAFVLFSDNVYEPGKQAGRSGYGNIQVNVPSDISLNTFLAANKLTTSSGSVKYDTETTSLISPGVSTGTGSGTAMEKARDILSGQTYSADSKRSKIVLFFTDGEPATTYPASWGAGQNRTQVATACISAAYTIKNTYGATVYSVGLLSDSDRGTEVSAFLKYTSSDDMTSQSMPTSRPSGGWPDVTGDKSIIVTNASALSNVFSSIAESAGGDYSASSSSSIMIDVVATSFAIPADADLGSVKVYQQKCKKPSADAILDFYPEKLEVPDSVKNSLSVNKTTGEVSVTKFDYGANWCGYDAENNTEHGYKLVLEIPIKAKDDAVGGPHVNTNTTDSKLIIKDKDGNVLSENVFPRPYVKLPVQIWIQKTGLKEDDSAVFNLRRTPYVGANVDYSASTVKWESWGEKIVCNKETMDENGIVKVSGLSPDYVYKIYEDAWGALGYVYQDDDTLYTVGDNVQNPFKFVNTPKNVVFDEAQVRNVFKKKE